MKKMKGKKLRDKLGVPVNSISTGSCTANPQPQEASAARISSDISQSSRKRGRQQKHRIRNQSAGTTLQDVLDIDGVQQKIMSQLPPRTLFNFTVVSKGWKTMINSNSYKTGPLKPYRNPAAIIIRRKTVDRLKVKFTHIPLGEVSGYGRGGPRRKKTNLDLNFVANIKKKKAKAGVTIIHSSNGLFICYSSVQKCFYLLNPTTRQSIKIPDSPNGAYISAMNLGFESPDKYKIFAVCQWRYGDYSLRVLESADTNILWRDIEVDFPDLDTDDGILFEYGVNKDGAIYWPRYLSTGLLIFKVREEELIWLPEIPQPDSSQSKIAYFGECRGYLRMVRYGSMRGGTFDMLELSSDYAMWFTMYHVDLNLVASAPEIPMHVLTLVPGEEEDEGDSCLIIHILGRVVSYSFKHKTTRDVCELSLRDSEMNGLRFQPWRFVHSYPETMLCPSLTAS